MSEEMRPEVKQPEFRELPPIERWSGSLITDMKPDEILAVLTEISKQEGIDFVGYLNTSDQENTYSFSRYPRKKYNAQDTEKLKAALAELAKYGTVAVEHKSSEYDRFRVLLGLTEGYGEDQKAHTPAEARLALGDDVDIEEVRIMSVMGDKNYQEDAVLVEGIPQSLKRVYAAADKFHQSRFAVEDLQGQYIHMVETQWCADPDEV